MPYDFPFKSVIMVDNQAALERNVAVANALLASFPEIKDLHAPDSDFYFTKTVIDPDKEYPEQHFYLEAEIDDFYYHFSFWKDGIYVEIGAGGDTEQRFGHLRRYAKVIMENGFLIPDPNSDNLLQEESGFSLHLEEYHKWTGFVDVIRKIVHPLK